MVSVGHKTKAAPPRPPPPSVSKPQLEAASSGDFTDQITPQLGT